MKRPTKAQYRDVARQRVGADAKEIAIHDSAKVRKVEPQIEEGAWVECWVFVRDEETRAGLDITKPWRFKPQQSSERCSCGYRAGHAGACQGLF